MPIVEPAPWRRQYFEQVACPEHVSIPTDDPEAWLWNPDHRWVFDKLQIALSQGLEAAPHGIEPRQYPAFSKPIVNLGGMGAGSRVLASRTDYLRHYAPGHMWMPLLEGRHLSTDAAVVTGSVKWWRHSTGLPTIGGMFDYWTIHAAADPMLEERLGAWIERRLPGYTGMLNLETIGGTIIEAHLRIADQWPDLYEPGWVEALVTLYSDGRWKLPAAPRRDGFSLALFGQHGRRYRHPPAHLVAEVAGMPGISSIQITFHEDRDPRQHAMPPGGFRVALVNAIDLQQGRAAREQLARWFFGRHRHASVERSAR